MLEDVLFKGIKKPKERKKKKIEQSFRIEGEELPKLQSFADLKTKVIFETPKLVQQLVIPYILGDRNVCVQSFTGSGKTLSYLLPLIELAQERSIKAIVLVPTDQLKIQVKKVMDQEIEGENKAEIIILKPSEISEGVVEMVTHLVIDEADVMIHKESLGLFKSLSFVLEKCTLAVFSATLNKEVEKIVGMFKDTTKVYVSNKRSVTHQFVFGTKDRVKHLSLEQVIEEGVEVPCLVFVNDIETGRKLAEKIPRSSFFEKGEDVLNEFRLKKIWFLFTTDVLSRGVDFINTKSVINYDFPPSKTTFIHRAGRVNRNTTGQKVMTIYTVDDFKKLKEVVEFLKENDCRVEEHIEKIVERYK